MSYARLVICRSFGICTVLVLGGCSAERTALSTNVAPSSSTTIATATTNPSSPPSATSAPAQATSTATATATATTSTVSTPPSTTTENSSGVTPTVVSRVATNDQVVFFTIDDGVVRDPAVVEFLRANNIPVTLFVNPIYVQKDPAYFASIAKLGNSVQDHTVNHPHLTALSLAAQQAEICGPLDGFAAMFGQRPWLLRPPYGAYDQTTLNAAAACGIKYVVTWHDTMNNGNLTTWGTPLHRGDIVLMHFRTDLLLNLRTVLQIATASGLHPASLTAYLPAS